MTKGGADVADMEMNTDIDREDMDNCTDGDTDKAGMEDIGANGEKIPQCADDADESASDDGISSAEEGDDDDMKDKSGGRNKKEKKEKKDKKDLLIDELTDKYRRTFAEFDNFRKRTEKEKSCMYEMGARDMIEKILPIVDNFERGLSMLDGDEEKSPFADGMDKIYKQLLKTLSDIGVKPMEAVGEEFNPEFHNAVMHVEDENVGENIIVEEFQKGYTYRDTVIRHSMVKVAN